MRKKLQLRKETIRNLRQPHTMKRIPGHHSPDYRGGGSGWISMVSEWVLNKILDFTYDQSKETIQDSIDEGCFETHKYESCRPDECRPQMITKIRGRCL